MAQKPLVVEPRRRCGPRRGLLRPCRRAPRLRAEPKLTIGFSLDTLKEERWQRDRDLFVAACEKLGARVLVQSANNDATLQNSQAENLLTQGVDVLRDRRQQRARPRPPSWSRPTSRACPWWPTTA